METHDPGGRVRRALAPDVASAAAFSPCRRWRWWLIRRWDGAPMEAPGCGVVIGMNPSTADETADDPTVAGVMWRARHLWGLPGLIMLNIFAYRATDKARLLEVEDPVGAENDAAILRFCCGAPLVVAAWGQPPRPLSARGPAVAAMLAAEGVPLLCFGRNADGSPKHPLYQRKDAPLLPFAPG
jgi:hypothetical protein